MFSRLGRAEFVIVYNFGPAECGLVFSLGYRSINSTYSGINRIQRASSSTKYRDNFVTCSVYPAIVASNQRLAEPIEPIRLITEISDREPAIAAMVGRINSDALDYTHGQTNSFVAAGTRLRAVGV